MGFMMELDLTQLRVFHAVVHSGSFSAAARALGRTQSAVSHAVRKLEETVGSPLLSRHRGLGLSPEGRLLADACTAIFGTLEQVQEELVRDRTRVEGRIRVGATIEFGSTVLMRRIGPFLAEHPGVELDFMLRAELLGPLLREEIDVAIDCVRHDSADLMRTPLFRESYLVACAPAYRDAHGLASPADLERCTVLSFDRAGQWWRRFLDSCRQAPKLGKVVAINNVRAMANAAVHGLGVLLAPAYAVQDELARGVLVELFPAIRPLEDHFALYQTRAKSKLARHRALREYLETLELAGV